MAFKSKMKLGTNQAVSQFLSERTKLLPGAHPEAPAAWTIGQMEQTVRDRLRNEIERINRGLFAPALIAATVIVGTSCIAAAVLYHFHSGPVRATSEEVLDTPTAP